MYMKKYLLETIKYALRSYPIIFPYVKKIRKMYEMDAQELSKRNEEQFLKIFRNAYNKSPFYRYFYQNAGIKEEDIKGIDDIYKLPILTKDMVRKYADDILIAPKWTVHAARTSGTTGTPLCIYENWKSIWISHAYTYYTRKLNGFTYGERLVSLRGHLDKNTTHLKVHLSNTLYLSSYNINKQTIQEYYNRIKKFNPRAIEGYPSSLFSLALFLKDANLKLQIPITFTSSETLLDTQRTLIEEQLGTQIYDHYGMTEHTIHLNESHDHKGYYEAPGYSINEYVDDGEISTSLINEAFPLIRYKTNDIMELLDIKTGHPQNIIKRIIGRVDEYVICKDGTMVTRIDFIEGGKHIKACQWIQRKIGELEILIVPDSGFTDKDLNYVIQETIKKVGTDNMDITTKTVEYKDLIYTSRGKFKLIVNLNK